MTKRIRKTFLLVVLVALPPIGGAFIYANRQQFMQDESNGAVAPLGRMNVQRAAHTATLLRTGEILIAGGMEKAEGVETNTNSAELFDPRNATFRSTGSMTAARGGHTATLLDNGDVLITGGFDQGQALNTAEIYHPETSTFTATGQMSVPRDRHVATQLQDASVLITGGTPVSSNTAHASAEIYEPTSGVFRQVGNMTTARSAHSATLLNDGTVLIAGGSMQQFDNVLSSAEIYYPATRSFLLIGNMTAPRHKHAATLLSDGRVLMTGGSYDARELGGRQASSELYDPKQRAFHSTGSMTRARFKMPTAVLALGSGNVLVAGDGEYLEMYQPSAGVYGTASGGIGEAWMYACAVKLGDGNVLITGGYNSAMTVTSGAWLYRPKRA